MKNKRWARAAALVMTICMAITMVPSTAFAAEAGTRETASGTKTVSLGNTALTTSGYSNGWNTANGLYVYFGQFNPQNNAYTPTAWHLLNVQNNTAFLDADEILWQDYLEVSDKESTTIWNETYLQNKLNGSFYYDNSNTFSSKEKSLIQETTHAANTYTLTNNAGLENPTDYTIHAKDDEATDHIFILSCKELDDLYQNETDRIKHGVEFTFSGGSRPIYWTRTLDTDLPGFGVVTCWTGYYDYFPRYYINWNGTDPTAVCPILGVSPAMNIDISSVAFTTKSGVSHTEGLFSNEVTSTADNHWVLTLADGNTNFSANRTDSNIITTEDGGQIALSVNGETETSNQLSAMVLDSSNNILYFGKIANKGADSVDVTVPSGLAIGKYTMKVFSEQAGANNYTSYASNMVEIPFAVKGKLSDVTLTPDSFGYDGMDKTPALSVKYNGSELTKDTDYTVSGTTTASANSSYTVTVTGIGNYTGTVEKTWNILKSRFTPSVTVTGWTYGDEPHAPSVTNNVSGGAVTYSYKLASADDSTYTTVAPKNAGEYTVKATIAETDGYEGATATANFTISPKAITVTAEAKSKVYGDADPALTYTVNDNGLVAGDSLAGALTRAAGTDAGSYAIQQGTLANPNYTINFVSANLTITAKEVTPTVELSPSSFAYDGTEKQPSVTLKDGDTVIPAGEYTVAYSNNTNVGTESVVTITDNTGGNYTFAQITRNFTITPKGITSVVTMDDYVYAAAPSTPVVSGNESHGAETIYYSTYSDLAANPAHRIEWKDMTGTSLNVGTYYMMVHVDATENYAEGNSAVIAFKVTPAKYSVPTAPTVNGFTVTVNEADREKKLEYSLDGTNWISVPKLDRNGGFELSGLSERTDYTIRLREKASADGNYLASDAVSTAFTTPTKYSVAYNANLGTGSVPASVTKNSGETVTVASGSGLHRTGYTFTGWNTAANGSGTSYAAGDSISSGATLYAQWTANHYTVKFDANGGTGTMADQEFTYDAAATAATALNSNTFTKANYYFAGWATRAGGSVAYTNGQSVKNLAANGSVTLYAVWVENQYSISGTITSNSNTNVTVKLMRGNTQVGNSQTVSMGSGNAPYTGTYNFTGIPVGTYNIVATQNGKTVTALVVVDNSDKTTNITMPSGDTNSILEVKEATPSVVVGGLDSEAETRAETSKSVTVKMTVEKQEEQQLPESATEEAKQTQEAITEIKSEASGKTLEFMDIGVEKEVKTGATVESTEKLSETNHVMEIVIPFDLSSKSNITVYRHHNGEVQTFTEGSDKRDGTFSVDRTNNLIYVYAKYFSTYAIGYTVPSSGNHGSGGSVTTYPVELPKSVSGGAVTADKSSVAKGATVTITVTPDKGYNLDKLTVTDQSGKMLALTSKGNGQYSFTMPAGKVTVAASFAETDWALGYRTCPKDETCPIWPYTDAETTAWYHDGVHFCLENGLMVGYGNHIFQPDTSTSRAMLSVMLWRLSGSPTVNYAMPFTDVAADSWYGEAVRWAASEGIVKGYDAQTFGPDHNVTREQMVTILYRYAQSKGYDVSVGEDTNLLSYADAASVAEYAVPAMQWACGSGMVQGTDNQLVPQGRTTRAQMATMMMRFCAEIVK